MKTSNFHEKDLIWFKNCLNDKNLVQKLKRINLVITDIDGSLTDCSVWPSEDGEERKGFSVQDGFGIIETMKANINIALVKGKKGKILEKRADALGITQENRYFGISKDKINAVQALQKNGDKERTLFFGDDFLDIETKPAVSIFACPSDAVFYIKPMSDLVIPRKGGAGAFRLLIDLLLFVQEKHFAQELIKNAIQ